MKKWHLLITLLVVGALFVPAVSAETIIDETIQWSADTSSSDSGYSYPGNEAASTINQLTLKSIQNRQFLSYIGFVIPGNSKSSSLVEGENTAQYTLNGVTKSCKVYIQYQRNFVGTITNTRFLIFFDDWDIGTSTGDKAITFSPGIITVKSQSSTSLNTDSVKAPSMYWGTTGIYGRVPYSISQVTLASYTDIKNHLTVESDNTAYYISLDRVINGIAYPTRLETKLDSAVVYYHEGSTDITQLAFFKSQMNTVKLIAGSNTYERVLTANDDPGTPTAENYSVTVYAQNAATGALINSVALGCKNAETSEWTNSTIDGGWTVIELPAGNYEFHGTATGFYQPAPGRLTVDGVGDNLALLLYPVGGTPPAGNVTLQVWCNYGVLGDGNRYGVPGAEVSIVGIVGEGIGYSSGILTANEQGFVTVEAPGNTSYSAYGSKIGYISGETEFSVLTGSPVHVSISLTPGAVPTEPPITPTPTVTPTPTETPVPGGFMDDAGNGIAQLFGVSLAVGKMLLGFLIALAVGMGTAKQLEGGAPEFVVGFTGAAFLSTVAGLIPIGFFVLVAVLAGIYLGKAYIGGGEGGR